MPANRKLSILIHKITVTVALLFLLQHNVLADTATDKNAVWETANSLYAQKQYDSAADSYEKLLPGAEKNSAVHYNLGNAYYRLNKVGAAILHYEKTLQLDPDNKQAADNLKLAKGRILNPLPEFQPIFFIRWWDDFVHAFHPNVWAWLSLLAFTAVLAVIYFARTRKGAFVHSGRWLSLSVVGLLICGCMAFFSFEARQDSGKAVVMQTGTSFFDRPQQNSKVLGTLPEGTVLLINQEQSDFYNVKLPNGREGWVAVGDLQKI